MFSRRRVGGPQGPTGTWRLESPLGGFRVDLHGGAVVRLTRAEARARPSRRTLPTLLRELQGDLARYAGGEPLRGRYSLAPAGTPFQRRVWAELLRIPTGEVRTYGEIARAVGKGHAARAVGQACKANPIPILIPCHRVVAAGAIGGYSGGGPGRKRKLLAIEGRARRGL